MLLAAAFAIALTQPAMPPACDPGAIVRVVRRALGADPTLSATGLVMTGVTAEDGLQHETREVVDFKKGRLLRDEIGAPGAVRATFDGALLWQRDMTGGVHPLSGADALRGARTGAYLRRYGFLHGERDPATIRCLGETKFGSSHNAVLAVAPRGGREVRLWIDLHTGLIASSQERTATAISTVVYADYRQVNGFALPFYVRTTDGKDTSAFLIRSAAIMSRPAPDSTFARPSTINEGRIDGAQQAVVPLLVENGRTIVEVSLRGHRLFFQLDSGGHAILTRGAARELGIAAFGSGVSGGGGEGTVVQQFTGPQTFAIGKARLSGIPFYVIDYGRDFTDRGPHRTPLAGILGLEVFERFAVRFDYARKQMSLVPLRLFRYRGSGARVPLTFEEDTPAGLARADGHAGPFSIDTGNSGGTILFGAFLRKHAFYARYPTGFDTTSSGTGGVVDLRTRRVRRFVLGGLSFENFITYFVDQQAGSFSSTSEAGNVGFDVLSSFATTFDYLHGVAYFEPQQPYRIPEANRVGLTLQGTGKGFRVSAVLKGSPAADAHIVPGDRVVRIGGIDASQLSFQSARALLRGRPGSVLALALERHGRTFSATVRLRELLCGNDQESCSPVVRLARALDR